MKKKSILMLVFIFPLLFFSDVYGKDGFYLGIQIGSSMQKPSIKDIEFSTDTSFLYGARAGIRFMNITVEANYFQAAHNLVTEDLEWGEREIDYNYIGMNLKYDFFSIVNFNTYLTVGYGYYTADIHDIDKDTDDGYNFGLGMELFLGDRFSLLAEGKYHHTKVDIENRELSLGDFSIVGGFNIYL